LNLKELGIVEMDISLRPVSSVPSGLDALAAERVNESDIGLSSVAIASNGIVWAAREYQMDRDNHTLTVFPRLNAERRIREYTEHMQQKFQDHQVIKL
jgi:hypothetical protein